MKIVWAIEGKGSGSAEAEDVDEAVRALSAAVRDCYKADGPSVQAEVLLSLVAPLRLSLVTTGRTAIEQGLPYSTQVRGIFVTLYP